MSKRRKLDFYETGQHAVDELIGRVELGQTVLEPCVGRGAISEPLRGTGRQLVHR